MTIRTESIGSIPRPPELIQAWSDHQSGAIDAETLQTAIDSAVRDTLDRLAGTGSTVLTDGEQSKPSFVTYPLAGSTQLDPDGIVLPFADGHTRQLPKLGSGPFRYTHFADEFLTRARKHTALPVKQAVIAPSALSLLYPPDGIDGYSREEFIADLTDQSAQDIRKCLDAGAASVQLDFTEGRLSLKLDPSGGVLRDFIALNNAVLGRFDDTERALLGVHTCPGGDQDSTHSADVDYADLLPDLFQLNAGRFYVQLASEPDRDRVLRIIADNIKPGQVVHVGVIDPIDPRVETAEEVRDRVLEAARHIPLDQLATGDDCGFSPFADDTSTSRDTAFAKITARVQGTALAAEALGA